MCICDDREGKRRGKPSSCEIEQNGVIQGLIWVNCESTRVPKLVNPSRNQGIWCRTLGNTSDMPGRQARKDTHYRKGDNSKVNVKVLRMKIKQRTRTEHMSK
ncbi:uncharacterized protein LOC118485052 [Helianthus annuus]|uniref:uncharacterized protein LOC118485052 n=1 Tax=Helianthus annuus TaxID=4232 RepID=UPI0016532F3F|nr:uncharacterized protein LOC118485052 [Helianthus annuus]